MVALQSFQSRALGPRFDLLHKLQIYSIRYNKIQYNANPEDNKFCDVAPLIYSNTFVALSLFMQSFDRGRLLQWETLPHTVHYMMKELDQTTRSSSGFLLGFDKTSVLKS